MMMTDRFVFSAGVERERAYLDKEFNTSTHEKLTIDNGKGIGHWVLGIGHWVLGVPSKFKLNGNDAKPSTH